MKQSRRICERLLRYARNDRYPLFNQCNLPRDGVAFVVACAEEIHTAWDEPAVIGIALPEIYMSPGVKVVFGYFRDGAARHIDDVDSIMPRRVDIEPERCRGVEWVRPVPPEPESFRGRNSTFRFRDTGRISQAKQRILRYRKIYHIIIGKRP